MSLHNLCKSTSILLMCFRCEKCDTEEIFSVSQLYEHMKNVHACVSAVESPLRDKRKGDYASHFESSPSKLQKQQCRESSHSRRNLFNEFMLPQEKVKPKEVNQERASALLSCRYCGLSFTDFSKLMEHLQAEHDNDDEENDKGNNTELDKISLLPGQGWWCEKCFVRFSSNEELKEHELMHRKAFQYEKPTSQSAPPLLNREYQCTNVKTLSMNSSSSYSQQKEITTPMGQAKVNYASLEVKGCNFINITQNCNMKTNFLGVCYGIRIH